ncbi:MAG: ABC transporter permease [Planctomycetaceae bacterium]|nr:ABC transporter permease [Planctomycetaceae bacterium]MCB9953523.1 ABC transporter permease [Planctomycetaceae bacterium]
MTRSASYHLFWKEYRTQRTLWLSLVAGVFLLQLVVVVFALISFGRTGTEQLGSGLTAIPIVLTICFAGASGSMLFAGEDEERTADYLRHLPVSPSKVLGAKALWLIVGTGLFVIATSLLTLVMLVATGSINELIFPAKEVMQFTEVAVAAAVWGVFWSLAIRKVMPALFVTAVSVLFAEAIMSDIAETSTHRLVPHFAFQILIALISWPMAINWMRKGTVIPWRISYRPTTSAAPQSEATTAKAKAGYIQRISERIQRILGSIKLAARLERAANQDSVASRTWSMLVWREMRALVPHVWLWGGVGAAAICLSCFSPYIPWFWLVFFVMLLEFGLKTFRDDHRDDVKQFLAQRGIPVRTVWLAKTLTWLPATMAVAIGLLLFDWAADVSRFHPVFRQTSQYGHEIAPSIFHVLGEVHAPHRGDVNGLNPHVFYPGISLSEDIAIRASLLFSFLLGLFGIGQLSSYWFRSSLLAWGGAAIASWILYILVVVVAMLDLPHFATLWPLVLAPFFATRYTGHIWYEQRPVRRASFIQLGWIFLPVVLISFVGWSLRAFPVPTTPFVALNYPPPPVSSTQFASVPGAVIPPAHPQSYDSVVQEAFDLNRKPQGHWRDAWMELAKFCRNGITSSNYNYAATVVEGRKPDGRFLVHRIAELDAELNCTTQDIPFRFKDNIPIELRVGQDGRLTIGVAAILEDEGNEQLAAGDTEAARETFLLAVKLERYLSHQATDWPGWIMAIQGERRGLAGLQRWAAHPDVTADQLRQTRQQVEDIVGNVGPLPTKMLYARYVVFDQFYQGGGPLWDHMGADDAMGETGFEAVLRSPLSWAERNRCRRLVAFLTLESLNTTLQPNAAPNPMQSQKAIQLQRWISTSYFLLPGAVYDPILQEMTTGESWNMNTYHDAVACERATQLILLLQAHRRDHGNFPDTILDLKETPDLFAVDPWSESYFSYAPKGFKTEMKMEQSLISPSDQPLLWTIGSRNSVKVREAKRGIDDQSRSTGTLKFDENRIYFTGVSTFAHSVADVVFEEDGDDTQRQAEQASEAEPPAFPLETDTPNAQ